MLKEEILKLQTYKLFEGDTELYVNRDEVLKLATVAKKETVQWIPVSERLPEFHDEVLVTALGEVAIAWLYVDGRWRSNDLVESMYKYITAWMPLPEPWKGEYDG